MDSAVIDKGIQQELTTLLEKAVAAGDLPSREQIDMYLRHFKETFEPSVLRNADGEALLLLMHGRQTANRCLAYWLEFKNDEAFAGRTFGGIGGGSALKFGLYQREADGAWITGSSKATRSLSLQEAIDLARAQREELLRGDAALAAMSGTDLSDAVYARLQKAMDGAAPHLSNLTWAHKYWFLLHSDRIDDYHVPGLQRFHLLKLLQMPPDGAGPIVGLDAPRFICAGRFASIAREMQIPITTLSSLLNRRNKPGQKYWRVGTTVGDTGESQWSIMRDRGHVAIGWRSTVQDLTALVGTEDAKDTIRQWLEPGEKTSGVATRKAKEILNFAEKISEGDLVLACEGQRVLGVGRVTGPYQYESELQFPHTRPVDWLLLDEWKLPEGEGLRTTVRELGREAKNLLELEQRLFGQRRPGQKVTAAPATQPEKLPPLDTFTARAEGTLQRKSQVIFYGPPGTGKTYRALSTARELAARHAFHRPFALLTSEEASDFREQGLVRVCTFHPSYGYEDFVEGLRARPVTGGLSFDPAAGIFKQLCLDAAKNPSRNYFLVIDEINRGDIARIFGELLTVLEQDKRGMEVLLPVTGKPFSIPRNVFVIGTMNTADRSISLLDAALRRRFGFIELMPDSSLLSGQKAGDLHLGAWLDALNARLRKHLKRDARNLQIGHSYLMPKQRITSVGGLARVLRDEIIPLLEDYCYDDFQALREILGPELVDTDVGRINEHMFDPEREAELAQALKFEEMASLLVAVDGEEAPEEPDTEEPEGS